MTRKMYDSVTPQDIPVTAALVAGYVDGRYNNISLMHYRFPDAVVVGIATSAHTNFGIVLDVESGDATPAQAVGWVFKRRQGSHDPTVYTSASEWGAVRAAFHAANVAEPHYWIADWDGNPVLPHGAVAKQYQSATRDHHYDLSVVADYWPGVDTPRHLAHNYRVVAGDTLSGIALRFHLTLSEIEHRNPQIKNFDLIHPGDIIHL
jgi:nucleoid-associated protein YgaU